MSANHENSSLYIQSRNIDHEIKETKQNKGKSYKVTWI